MTTPTVAPRTAKKLINRVEDLVPESLSGLGAAHSDLLQIDATNRVVLRAGGAKRGKVGLVSGGGSGHEPLHGGFVGLGMLDAACAGHVFTSPTPDQMVAASGTPTFELGDNEMEIGIGIHGEPGRRRVPLAPVDEIAEMLLEPIVGDLGLKAGDTVLAFVNGMGGTPLIELYVAFNSVNRILKGKGVAVGRSLVGNYITSLEMAGFSITLLRLDDELTRLWDAPVHTPALRWRV